MRVDTYNAYKLNRTQSGARGIGNVPLPDFNGFQGDTKSAPAMSDNKYREAIVEQAKRDQAEGKFQPQSPAFKSLQKSYVSVASPDRQGIISKGLNSLFQQDNLFSQQKRIKYPYSLIDVLFGNVTFEKEKTLSYAEFQDENGELVATFSNNGWTFYGTKAENARSSEFLSIYNKAWGDAAKNAQNESGAISFVSSDDDIPLNVLA